MDEPTAFIFDMDGTLVDNTQFHLQAWLQLLAELDVQVTAEEFHRRSSGKTSSQTLRHVLDPGMTDDEIKELAERKEVLYRNAYGPHRKLVAGLDQFLTEAVHSGISMAIATSGGRVNIEFVLNDLGVLPLFQAVVGGEDVNTGKPDPEAFLLAAKRLEIPPEQCIVFEDSLVGVEAAYRAGMEAVALTTSFSEEAFTGLPGVILVVQDFASLHPQSVADAAQESRGQRGS